VFTLHMSILLVQITFPYPILRFQMFKLKVLESTPAKTTSFTAAQQKAFWVKSGLRHFRGPSWCCGRWAR